MKIAMVKDRNRFWEIYQEILTKQGHEVFLYDIFNRSEQEKLLAQPVDAFIWRAKHTPKIRNLAKRMLYFFEFEKKVKTYPSWQTYWHYDDKLSQYYVLKEKAIPTPGTYIFYHKEDALNFSEHCQYPLIYKCAHGAGSSNVGLIKNRGAMRKYIKKAFGKGLPTYFKSEIQKDYVYFQEFLPKNRGDYRVVCLGASYLSGFFRQNREDNPFASGSGKFDINTLPEDLIAFVSDIHSRLHYDFMSYDILRDENNRWVVTEMSVIFGDLTHVVYDQAENYERASDGSWHGYEGRMNRHELFIDCLLKQWNGHG